MTYYRRVRWGRILLILWILLLLGLIFFFGRTIYDMVIQLIETERARIEAIESKPEGVLVTATSVSSRGTPTPVVTETPVTLTVAFESSASHLLIFQVAEFEQKEYEISLMPLYFNGKNKYVAEELAMMLENGEIDMLFTGAQFLPRFGNIGRIIFPVDQSSGADQIVSWTDSITQTTKIAVVENSRGHFLTLAYLRLNELPVDAVAFVFADSDEEVVQLFLNREVEAVAGRVPHISRAVLAGGTVIVSTDQFPVIFDVAIASKTALEKKRGAIAQFVTEWYRVLKMLQEDSGSVAETISVGRYEQETINGWTRIYRYDAVEDLKDALAPLAQSSLEDASAVMGSRTPVVDLLQDAYSILVWSGTKLATFNAEDAIDPSFVIAISEDTTLLPTSGELTNESFQLTPFALEEKERN